MASYDAAVNVVIRNERSLARVITRIEQVSELLNKINATKVNLFGKDSGLGGDIARKQLKELQDNIRAVANESEDAAKRAKLLGNTVASTAQSAGVYASILQNVSLANGGLKRQSGEVKTLASAWAVATKQAETYASRLDRVQNEASRQLQGLQPQEERDIEVERRKQFVHNTRLRRQEQKVVQDTVDTLKQQRIQESVITEELAERTRELNKQVRLRASISEKIQQARSARIARERSAFLQGDPQAYERPAGPGGAFRFPQADAIEAAAREQRNFNALQEQARKTAQSNLQLQYNWAKALGQRKEIAKELRTVAANDLQAQKEAAKIEERRLRLARRRADVLRAREKAERTKRAVGEGIIGGAFPLLFGQGAGSAIGGGLGGVAGGLMGGQFGFGLSLVGTALGSAFDEFTRKSKDLSVALDTAGDSTQALEALIGRLDTTTSNQITNLAASGQAAEAASLTFKELAEKIGRDNAAAVIKAGRDFDTLGNLWQQFTTAIGASIAQLIQEAFYLNLDVDPRTGQPSQQGPSLTEAATRRGERLTAELAIEQKLTEAAKASRDSDIEKLAILETTIAKKQADLDITLVANELKDKLISKKDYERKQAIIQEQLERDLLDIEEKRTKAVEARGKAQDRAAKAAIREAEQLERALEAADRKARAIAEAKASAQINEINATKALFASSVVLTRQQDGELAAAKQRLNQLDLERNDQLKILEIRYEQQAQDAKSLEEHKKLHDIYTLQYHTVVNTYETERLKTQELLNQLEIYGNLERISAAAGFKLSTDLAGAFVPKGAEGILSPGAGLPDFMTGAELARIVEQEVALARVLEKYQEIGQAAQLTSELVTTGFTDMVSGTRSAEEVFAQFLNSLADMLIKTAQQMIAQYIAIGIARLFATGGSFNPSSLDLSGSQFAAGSLGPLPFGGTGFPGRANGGPVSGGTPYMVGERGPELFVPRASGTIVPNDKMGGGVTVGSINISVENSGDSLSPAAQKQIAGQVQGIVLSTLANERRSGGML